MRTDCTGPADPEPAARCAARQRLQPQATRTRDRRRRRPQRPPARKRPARLTCRRASTGSRATSMPPSRRPRRPNKPVFLYWGAEWCPPCAQIKSTIFNKREFQERTRLFVPVYLDGDTPSAQKLRRALRRRRLPDHDPVPAGRHRDHAPARHRGHRALRDHSRRGARRRAPGRRDPCGGIDRRRGHRQRLAAARVLLLGRPTTAASCPPTSASPTFRRLYERCPPELRPECGRLFFEYLGAAARMRAGRTSRRSTASSAPMHAASCSTLLPSPAGRRRPTSTTCCTRPRTSSACCPTPARPSAAS